MPNRYEMGIWPVELDIQTKENCQGLLSRRENEKIIWLLAGYMGLSQGYVS